MNQPNARLRPGDLVEVKAPDEILKTLDADGALDHLPFMPEMLKFCGRRFFVSGRVVKICATEFRSSMRGFRTDDIVLLDALRCSGAAHDGCQKACTIFWREAWLRKPDDATAPSPVASEGVERLRVRLKTLTGPKTYFCQASELLKATTVLSRWERLGTCLSDVRARNCTALQMAQRIAIWLFWRIRRTLLGEYAHGRSTATPVESLHLRPGEWVDVKSKESIAETLSEDGRNRGLYFMPGMRLSCGGQYRVKERIDKIIVDGTGEMRRLDNTVRLEGSLCGCAQTAFGGCSRGEVAYWREIWLRRAQKDPTTRVEAVPKIM